MLVYILVIIVAALVALPFIWMVVSAFKSQRELFAYPPTFFPTEWKWENFTEAASRGSISFWAMFLNSMKIAVPSTLFNVIFSSLAGYAFARLRFPGRDKIFMCFLAAMMVPFVITLIPRFLLFRDLGFYDTYVPLIVPAMFGTPFSIFLTRQFFMTLPKELDHFDSDGVPVPKFLQRLYGTDYLHCDRCEIYSTDGTFLIPEFLYIKIRPDYGGIHFSFDSDYHSVCMLSEIYRSWYCHERNERLEVRQ